MNRERSARIIPPDLISVQIEASDPEVSAWVAANAGSGSIYVRPIQRSCDSGG